jgi:hypothetical protein
MFSKTKTVITLNGRRDKNCGGKKLTPLNPPFLKGGKPKAGGFENT